MNFSLIIVIAISLSMDAFSLCLAYGTLNLSKKDIYTLSITVGIYHFIMPLLGYFIGSQLLKIIPINTNLVVFLVLLIIGIEMIVETFKESEITKKMKIVEIITFGLAVSIDAFSVGIGLKELCSNTIVASIIFSLTSLIFTYLGLVIGNKISKIIGRVSTFLGGIALIIIAIMYII